MSAVLVIQPAMRMPLPACRPVRLPARLPAYSPACPHGTTRLSLGRLTWKSCLSIYRKSVENIQVWLKSDKNNRYSTWRRMHIYDCISLHSSFALQRWIHEGNWMSRHTYRTLPALHTSKRRPESYLTWHFLPFYNACLAQFSLWHSKQRTLTPSRFFLSTAI